MVQGTLGARVRHGRSRLRGPNGQQYLASFFYGLAKSAEKAGIEKIFLDTKGSGIDDGDWTAAFMEHLEGDLKTASSCIVFVDLGGGSLTGKVYSLAENIYKKEKAEYKSKTNCTLDDKQYDKWCTGDSGNGMFADYSRASREEKSEVAGLLVQHIAKAYEQLAGCPTPALVVRQTGKIRYQEFIARSTEWEVLMRQSLDGVLANVKMDYALLKSQDEALYEGEDFWKSKFNTFQTMCGDEAVTEANAVLMQVGSSSTQASTYNSSRLSNKVKPGSDGILGTQMTVDQGTKVCSNSSARRGGCFNDIERKFAVILQEAQVKKLKRPRILIVLNSIKYLAKDFFSACNKIEDCSTLGEQWAKKQTLSSKLLAKAAATFGGFTDS